MPAATLAGALALAGCGGSDNKSAVDPKKDDPKTMPAKPACADPGVKPNADGTDCVPDTAKADAAAKMAKLNSLADALQGATPSSDFSAFPDPKDPKDAADPQASTGWEGAAHTGTSGGNPVTRVVYTNKGPDTQVDLGDWEPADGDAPGEASGVYTITAALAKYIEIAGLPSDPNHKGVEIGTVGVAGKFAGADGKFSATSAKVEIKVDKDGKPTFTSPNLRFTPDKGAKATQEDQSYASLGWWMVTDKDDSSKVMSVETRAWGTGDAYDPDDDKLEALIGKATFEGISVGKYTHRTGSSVAGGHFNADATLEMDYAGNAEGTLSGTIENFMQDGKSIGNGWKVELGSWDTDKFSSDGSEVSSGNVAFNENEHNAQGTFGSLKLGGGWNADLVGNDRKDNAPEGVVGNYQIGSSGTAINMLGSFAAHNTSPDQE